MQECESVWQLGVGTHCGHWFVAKLRNGTEVLQCKGAEDCPTPLCRDLVERAQETLAFAGELSAWYRVT